MDKEIKKIVTPNINEELMMNLMVEGVKKEGIQFPLEPIHEPEKKAVKHKEFVRSKPVQGKKSRIKNSLGESYGDYFLKTHSMAKRGDKSIYIRQEYHERLSRIIQVIGRDGIPLYAYLDNILEHHFEMFEKAITEDFNENFKPIF